MIVPEDDIMCMTPTPEQETRMEQLRKFYKEQQFKQNWKNLLSKVKNLFKKKKDTEDILIDDIPDWDELGDGIKVMCLELAKEQGDENFLRVYGKSLEK